MPNEITVCSPDEYRPKEPAYRLGPIAPETTEPAQEFERFESLTRTLVHAPKQHGEE